MSMVSLTMEEKQLDFNRPLLSVRRPTQASESESKPRSSDPLTNKIPPPSSAPPVYKSDIKSGPVRNPGTVPFQWEHQPGKPKDETKPDSQSFFVEPRYVPKLPPGRRVREREASVMRRPETRLDDTYLDAADDDTLSRSESFFYNCSNVSGHGGTLLVEPFGTLSGDRQTQDLMMGRFLPAAKALTSETPPPPHLSRKPPKPEEPVKEKQNKAGDNNQYQICLRSSFGVRMQAQRGVSVRRMRSKYQDSSKSQNKNNEPVNEDERELKLNGSVALGGSLAVESSCTSRTRVSRNFGELLASDDNTWKPSSDAPMVAEKTLYVDTVHSLDKKVQEDSKEISSLDVAVPVKEEVQNLNGPGEEAISQPKTTEQSVTGDEAVTGFSSQKVEECPDQANVVVEITKEKIDLEAKLQRKYTANLESSRLHQRPSSHIVPPPPLPKAPSDSWLKRTLPTIPTKNNSFTWLQSLGADNNKIHQASPKWETMVKTSNTQQGFVCFSKETLNPIPEA
ncbi:Arginine N-methyltransferase [Hirschfeldia incana]|nr:Arginine N-methyltransferase [Hirschfeldia incana]